MNPASIRLAARLARREVRRRPWRTVLVALLVAIPVSGMTLAAGFVRTDAYDADADWERSWGASTDIAVSVSSMPGGGQERRVDPQQYAQSMPAGSKVTTWRSVHTILRTTVPERSAAEVVDLPMTEQVGQDRFQITAGRVPAAAGEVFLTRAAAKELGVEVGGAMALDKPVKAEWRVVGVGEMRAYWGAHVLVLGMGTAFPWDRSDFGPTTFVVVDLPETISAAQALALAGDSGSDALAPDLRPPGMTHTDSNTDDVAWSWVIGAVVLTVMGIVIASAFAAGARRQLTTLGQLAANGAAPAVLRRVLFLQGTWTGAIGTAAGLILGAVWLSALAPHADRVLGRDVEPWIMRPFDLVPVVALGLLAPTLAALIPARSTARVPVLAALAGRRPLAPVPRWVTVGGAVTVVAGMALLGLAVLGGQNPGGQSSDVWALTAILGGVAVLLGACAVAPGYTSVLAPVALRTRGAWRLAARSLARQRTRSSAVVAGVCAAAALSVAASSMVLSSVEQERRQSGQDQRASDVQLWAEQAIVPPDPEGPIDYMWEPKGAPAELVASLQKVLPGAQRFDVPSVQAPAGQRWNLDIPVDSNSGYVQMGIDAGAVLSEATSAVYGLRPEHRKVLEQEGMLFLGQQAGKGELSLWPVDEVERFGGGPRPPGFRSRGPSGPTRPPQAFAVVDGRDYPIGGLPRLLVTREGAARAGLVERPPLTVLRNPADLTRDEATRVSDVIQDYRLETDAVLGGLPGLNVFSAHMTPSDAPSALMLEAALAGVALLFSLFVVATSLALAAAETRDERDVLTVVGAPPRTMWQTSGRKALLLTALGGVLAVPVGFLPVVVLTWARYPDPPLVFPWRVVALVLFAVPLAAAVATSAGSALALRLRPVRISTMAFD